MESSKSQLQRQVSHMKKGLFDQKRSRPLQLLFRCAPAWSVFGKGTGAEGRKRRSELRGAGGAALAETLPERLNGFLDEQFMQLEELQDEINPNFVEEVVTLFFRDSTRLIINIEQALQKPPLDFSKLDAYMHQLKGSGSSIGAYRVKNECSIFRQYCEDGNAEGCTKTFHQVKKEHAILKKKLETYFVLARQAGPMETASRPL